MPADFETCRAGGGKIRTIKIGKNKYAHVCIDSNGKTHMGEIKETKSKED